MPLFSANLGPSISCFLPFLVSRRPVLLSLVADALQLQCRPRLIGRRRAAMVTAAPH